MNLNFTEIAAVGRYKSASRKIRALGEARAERNLLYSVRGNPHDKAAETPPASLARIARAKSLFAEDTAAGDFQESRGKCGLAAV